MDSEKVKEIKIVLKGLVDDASNWLQTAMIGGVNLADILTLINELESENKSLQNLCNKTYEDLTKEIDRLENRVKELEEGIAQSMLGCEFLPECTNDKLKQFAERLKEKLEECSPFVGYDLEDLELDGETIQGCIDETLKEFINEQNKTISNK